MSSFSPDKFVRICKEFVVPILRADGGELYLVKVDDTSVALHLGGRCGGCPGREIAIEKIIKPAIYREDPDVSVSVSYGVNVPDGASLL